MARSKTSEVGKSRRENGAAVESNTFTQTFDKPTQIYRYLKTRSLSSPLFLHRNLSYMKGRCTRKNRKSGETVKEKEERIVELIKQLGQSKKGTAFGDKPATNKNLIIGFIRFDDELLKEKQVKVETKLEKISHKRRKEGTSGQNETIIGTSIVVVNSDENGTEKLPAVCVHNEEFKLDGDQNVATSYQLTFTIEPLATSAVVYRKDIDEPQKKLQIFQKMYQAKMPVFDKHGRNLLLNGIYQVTALEPNTVRSLPTNWEDFENNQRIEKWAEEVNTHFYNSESNPFTQFEETAKIQLYMEWKNERTTTLKYIDKPKFITDQHNNNNKDNSVLSISTANGVNTHNNCEALKEEPMKDRFIFQFVVNQNIKQRTEERNDYMCPWCSLDCIRLYSLMKHLKLCHARFLFHFVDESPIRRIDVYLNEMYDGSYSGAPHDVLVGTQHDVPTRRAVVTHILFRTRGQRPTFKMSEFLEIDDGELDQQRQYSSGHNRIYYHSETCIPIMPKELDYDSEGDPDPKWLQRTTKQMIDEFTDVNDGEKELIKLWNLHCMKHGFVGDCQMKLACNLFVEEKGKELIEKNLLRNYFNHLHSLFDYELISPKTTAENYSKLLKLQVEIVGKEKLRQDRKMKTDAWIKNQAENLKKSEAATSKIMSTTPKTVQRTAKAGEVPTSVKTKASKKRTSIS